MSKTNAIALNAGLANCAIISIVSPGEKNPDFISQTVLKLQFHDITEKLKGFVAFNAEIAKQILDFVKSNSDKNVVVHCEAGLSRSAAIVRFLVTHMEYDGEFANTNNWFVYKILCEEYNVNKSNSYYEDVFGNTEKPTLFLDMDGVFVDFLGECARRNINTKNPHSMWKSINSMEDSIFEIAPKLDWADSLWNMVREFNPTFLTGDPKQDRHRQAKRIWLDQHFNYDDVIIYPSSKKQHYAGNGNILIDDSQRNINNWNAAGGHGILFTDLKSTFHEIEKAIKML